VWGLGAAVGAYAVSLATGWASWAAIAHLGAWINLFNLIPVFGLDGAHGFSSLTRLHRWIAVSVAGLAALVTQDGMLVLITLLGAIRASTGGAKTRDDGALWLYVFLILALGAMLLIEVPGIPRERAPIFGA
jgi:Zn-dependent protease